MRENIEKTNEGDKVNGPGWRTEREGLQETKRIPVDPNCGVPLCFKAEASSWEAPAHQAEDHTGRR